MKKVLKSAMALAMVMSLAACGSSSSSSSSSEAFKIGCSGPLTGAASIYGKAVENAANLAVEEINAEGKVNLEFKMEDDEADAEKSPTAYSNLVDWGMQIGLGTVTSGAGIAVSQNYQDDETFAITPSGSNTAVVFKTDDEAYGNVFQMCFTDPNQGVASADYMAENFAGKKVAVIYNSASDYSTTIHQKFVAEAKDKGVDIVSDKSYADANDNTVADFSAQVSAAKKAGAEVVFLPIYYTPAAKILAEMKKQDYTATVFGVDGMDGILTLEDFDTSLAEGVYLLTPFSADSEDETTSAFVKAYEEKYGETPNQFAADAYDAIYAIAQALEAGEATADMSNADLKDLLVEQFTSMTFDGVTGKSVTWAETGEVSKNPFAVVIKDGVYVTPEA